jgi:hypothetical protein
VESIFLRGTSSNPVIRPIRPWSGIVAVRAEKPARIPSIDILPDEYRGGIRLTNNERSLALFILGLLLVAGYLGRTFLSDRQELARLRVEERALLAQQQLNQPLVEKRQALQAEIQALQAEVQTADLVKAKFADSRDWGALVGNALVSLPEGVQPRSITTPAGGGSLVIEGTAATGFAGMQAYYSQLRATPGVAGVAVDRAVQETSDTGVRLLFTMTVRLAAK